MKEQLTSLERETTQQRNELQQNNEYVNKLRTELKLLNRQLNDKNRELVAIKIENEQLKKSYWYKLSKIFKR
ncbi:hypothetical protein [Desulfosporosinus youngiae]|uniref:Uncharacterized protein n=1 Tax=Desulfosporosinus youngiae DSM 17734 TaxID=768710 RepID=H5Y607_9FIRM|nr:hypothetical protein [Desulfosporosinus youngiae]EHQ90946.1 hypothetical protein DesyoDRAFT_3973 [Desulfosporosinus youngiae DSM 17734]